MTGKKKKQQNLRGVKLEKAYLTFTGGVPKEYRKHPSGEPDFNNEGLYEGLYEDLQRISYTLYLYRNKLHSWHKSLFCRSF